MYLHYIQIPTINLLSPSLVDIIMISDNELLDTSNNMILARDTPQEDPQELFPAILLITWVYLA